MVYPYLKIVVKIRFHIEMEQIQTPVNCHLEMCKMALPNFTGTKMLIYKVKSPRAVGAYLILA